MNELLRRILFLPPQSSSLAREIDYLHYSVILITMAGATAVAVAAAYFILRYRRSTGRARFGLDQDSKHMAGGVPYWVEFGSIGFLLALFVTWWVVGFHQFVKIETQPRDAIEIYATGKQWMWTFAYPNGSGSNGVLYVPTKRNVRLVMSARDVIHSFYVPEFRVKKDVIPGAVTNLWFSVERPGDYQALCTEYCGEGHSTMRARVVALSEADYLERIAELPQLQIEGPEYREPAIAGEAPREATTLAAMGERVAANRGCLRCHTTDGAPHIGPTWAGVFGAEITLENGEHIVADAAYLTESMMDPLAKLRSGYQPVMPTYRGLLSAPEIGALLEFMRSLAPVPADAPASPLAPADSPPVTLPTEGSSATLPTEGSSATLPSGAGGPQP